ncbi:MAG: hypothetical protein KDA20_06905 [Phycisphaerales bacterium]|nr:hypothetical protein [Phycisphaerales bacterium]
MRLSRVILAAAAVLPLAQAANAGVFNFDWNAPDPLPGGGVSNAAGTIKSVHGSYDSTSQVLTWDVRVENNTTDAITLVLSGGPNPKSNPGQFAHFFYDGSALTVYGYNGKNNTSSWWDGNGDGSGGDPDRIASSLVDPGFVMELSKGEDAGDRLFHMKLDVSGINAHMPLFEDPDGEPWEGAQFAEKVGIWMHTFDGTPWHQSSSTAYENGWLKKWAFKKEGWMDTENSMTTPTPGALALAGMGGVLAMRRRRNA